MKGDQFSNIKKLIEHNKYVEAISALDKIIKLEKGNHEAYILKAGVLQLMEKQDEAINLYKYIIGLFPDNSEAYLELISIYDICFSIKKTDKINEKIIELCKRVELIDKSKTPYYISAKAYRGLGKTDLELEAYDKAIKQEAIYIRTYAMLLKEYDKDKKTLDYALGKIDERRNILLRALEDKASCLKQIAEFEETEEICKTAKFQEAINAYKIAIELNTLRNCEYESYLEYRNIGEIYNLLGDHKKSKFYIEKAEQSEKLDRDVYDKSRWGMTEDEFNEWFDNYFELDDKGNIIKIRNLKK